jgi:hypothetical protein
VALIGTRQVPAFRAVYHSLSQDHHEVATTFDRLLELQPEVVAAAQVRPILPGPNIVFEEELTNAFGGMLVPTRVRDERRALLFRHRRVPRVYQYEVLEAEEY